MERQINKYPSHAIAPRVTKHFLYTFIICIPKFQLKYILRDVIQQLIYQQCNA